MLQNEKGRFEPDSCFCEIYALVDPAHRCRYFGKEIKNLQHAPQTVSNVTEEQALRLIKEFKYWYHQSCTKDFDEIKRLVLLPLLHMLGEHTLCSEDWCYKLQADKMATGK